MKYITFILLALLILGCTNKAKQETTPNHKPETTPNQHFANSLKDTRDGKTYKIVKIGEQTWMAENLNYETKDGKCYDDSRPALCQRYGRLYNWYAALSACPEGWHLPSDAEWQALVDWAGGNIAGKMLKSKSGWEENASGENAFGFSALPGGYYSFHHGRDGYWWSRTERNDKEAFGRRMSYDVGVWNVKEFKSDFYSVRCVQGNALNLSTQQDFSEFFASGNGTKVNPYIITTKKHLENFSKLVTEGNDFKNIAIKLGANIMLNDTADWKNWEKTPPTNSWNPIGGWYGWWSFKGTFDGDGYVVGGVYMYSKYSSEIVGFFGTLASGAEIKNLGIVASYIKHNYIVNGLVGENKGGNISNSYFKGMINGEIKE